MSAQYLINTYQTAIGVIGKRGRLMDARHLVSNAERNSGMTTTVYANQTTNTKAGFMAYCETRIAALSLACQESGIGDARDIPVPEEQAWQKEVAPRPDIEPLTRYELEQAATDADTPAEDAERQEALRKFDASHPAGTTARVAIQCPDHAGRVGCFLYVERNGERVALSPVSARVADVFDWCRANGWKGDASADVYTKDHAEAHAEALAALMLPTSDPVELAELFRDWMNNFVTVECFAEHHGFTVAQAHAVIAAGRTAHDAEDVPVTSVIEEYRTAVLSTAHMMESDYQILTDNAAQVGSDDGLFWIHDTQAGAILRFKASYYAVGELAGLGASRLLIDTILRLEKLGYQAAHFDRDADRVTGWPVDPQYAEEV